MSCSEVSMRYARALYDLASENGVQEKVFSDLRALDQIFEQDVEFKTFLLSPVIQAGLKEKALAQAFKNSGVSQEVESFLLLLAQKGRLGLYSEVLDAYQAKSDEAHGVTRGTVYSASVLGPEERSQVEKYVSQTTGKQVILTYREDPTVIGGLVAEVGSFTFDDTIKSHLIRLREDLKRRAH